jgi:hypothetical protein
MFLPVNAVERNDAASISSPPANDEELVYEVRWTFFKLGTIRIKMLPADSFARWALPHQGFKRATYPFTFQGNSLY